MDNTLVIRTWIFNFDYRNDCFHSQAIIIMKKKLINGIISILIIIVAAMFTSPTLLFGLFALLCFIVAEYLILTKVDSKGMKTVLAICAPIYIASTFSLLSLIIGPSESTNFLESMLLLVNLANTSSIFDILVDQWITTIGIIYHIIVFLLGSIFLGVMIFGDND